MSNPHYKDERTPVYCQYTEYGVIYHLSLFYPAQLLELKDEAVYSVAGVFTLVSSLKEPNSNAF